MSPTDDDPAEESASPVVEGAAEGARQTEMVSDVVWGSSQIETGTIAAGNGIGVASDGVRGVTDLEEGPSMAVDATTEVYESLVNGELLASGAAAVSQFLIADPSDPTGPIDGTLGGSMLDPPAGGGGPRPVCASITGFWWQADLTAETDPPLARLEVTYDASLGAACTRDGVVRYDLRTDPAVRGLEALRLVIAYPSGFTSTGGESGDRVIAAGGTITLGLLFDGVLRFAGVEVGADYCVGDGSGSGDTCLRNVNLAVSASSIGTTRTRGDCTGCTSGRFGGTVADRLAGDDLEISVTGGSIAVTAIGTIEWGDDSLTFGMGTMPLTFEVGSSDTSGLYSVLDGAASSTIDGTSTELLFEALPGATEPGLRANVPPGTTSVVVDGCSASTIDAMLTRTCWDAFTLAAAEGTTAGSTLFSADGSVTRTEGTEDTVLTYAAASIELGGEAVVVDGSITHTDPSGTRTVAFEALTFGSADGTTTVSGALDVSEDGVRTVRADFCDPTTIRVDSMTEVTTVAGCFVLENATGTLSVGSISDPVAVQVSESFVAYDGAVTIDDPAGERVFGLEFESFRSENLDPGSLLEGGYHRSLTGRASLESGSFMGSIESMSGFEARLATDGGTDTIDLDGDLGVSFVDGTSTVSGTMTFTTMQVVRDASTTSLAGTTQLDFDLGSSTVLPAESLRLTYGDTAGPMTTTLSGTITTMDGFVGIGVDCAPSCAMDVSATLTGLAYDAPACGRQSPHAGTAVLSGLTPSLAAVIPALQVACDCNGRAGADLMLPESVTMEFDAQTPIDGTIGIPAATGTCVTLLSPGTTCNDVGEARVAPTMCM